MIVIYCLLVLIGLFVAVAVMSTLADAVLVGRERRYYRYRDRRLLSALAMMAESPPDATFSFREPRLRLAILSVERPRFAWRGPFPKLEPFEETMIDLSRTCWIGAAADSDGVTNEQFREPDFRFRLTEHGRRRYAYETALRAAALPAA